MQARLWLQANNLHFEVGQLFSAFTFLFCHLKEVGGREGEKFWYDFVKAAAWSKDFVVNVKNMWLTYYGSHFWYIKTNQWLV